jgi:hypothetical protein
MYGDPEWVVTTDIFGISPYLFPILLVIATVILFVIVRYFRPSWLLFWVPEEIPTNLVVLVGGSLLLATLGFWSVTGYLWDLLGMLSLTVAVLLGIFTWPKWWNALMRAFTDRVEK